MNPPATREAALDLIAQIVVRALARANEERDPEAKQ